MLRRFTLFSAVLLLHFFFSNAVSQTMYFKNIPSDEAQIGLRFLHPNFEFPESQSALSGIFELSLNIPVSEKLNIIGELPFINCNVKYDHSYYIDDFTESGLGNIFIGLQTQPAEMTQSFSILTFGLFLPTVDEKVALWGVFSNYYESSKYYPNSLGVYFNYARHKIFDNGINLGLELGPDFRIPTKEKSGDTELFLHYGLKAGYSIEQFNMSAEFVGTAIITEDYDNFSDRLMNAISFGAAWKEKLVTPQLFYSVYLKDSMSDIVGGVLGLKVTVSLDQL